MTTVAVLDANGVLAGYKRALPEDYEPGAGEVVVPDDCDLAVGRYRHDGAAFLPLPRAGSAEAVRQPNVLRAIFLGFQAIETRFPGTLPAETRSWLNQFAGSLDNVSGG